MQRGSVGSASCWVPSTLPLPFAFCPLPSPCSPTRGARRRIPLAAVGFFLEDRRRQSHGTQILWILDLRRDREPLLTIRPLVEIPVLGHHGVLAVGDAVLPQVSRAKVFGDDLQRSTGRTNGRSIR